MKTTLNLDDDLVRAAKKRAVETERTLTEMVESGLREVLRAESAPRSCRLKWVVARGGAQPGVDLSDRDTLYDRMEGRR